jgi:hypothetical protein
MVKMSHRYVYALRNSYVGFQQSSMVTTARSINIMMMMVIIIINSNPAHVP